MYWLIRKCNKCGGNLYIEEDVYGRYISCLQCGFTEECLEKVKVDKNWKGLVHVGPIK